MKRTLGISRSKYDTFLGFKTNQSRKKNIFKYIGKEDDLSDHDLHSNNKNLILDTSKNSAHSADTADSNPISLDVYETAKMHLQEVAQFRKKMTSEIKMRMGSFKESDIKVYDDNISKFSAKAVENLVKSQKILSSMKMIKGRNQTEEKFYRNMERSLGMQIREVSRALRTQEKDYFDRLRMYETGTLNTAIQLGDQDRRKMKDQFEQMQVWQAQLSQNVERNKQITDLAKSINQLSSIYKQLNELVIDQCSLIDRIDFNIEETLVHLDKGVDHLRGAEENASSPFAQKCMFILILLILAMAIVIGFKLSK